MRGKPIWTQEWLEANGYPVFGAEPERPRPAPVPRHTKPAGELRRGDEVRTSRGWESVCSAEPGLEGRVRVTLPGPKLLGWFPLEQAIEISPATAKAWEPRRRQLRGRDLMSNVLKTYFPDTDDHGGALDVATQLAGFLPAHKPHELETAISESLEAKGLARPVAASAALRCRVAWLMAMGGH